ncbi:MAG: 4-alpha-glucanotransferase [Treponema sp.]|jgi:4-alpha-glucanotransferase|nr:4-alpha-glucanotransferase [Treponema sp.]
MQEGKRMFARASGVLLAVSSLPSPYGIGSFGKTAKDWIDFLEQAGQKCWQLLPLGVTSWGDSPYMSFSAFAINPYYIDLDALCEQGLLEKQEIAALDWGRSPDAADYALLYRNREIVLSRAFSRARHALETNADFMDFCEKNSSWLKDFCLFMALKKLHGGVSWLEWEREVRLRDAAALERHERDIAEAMQYNAFLQFLAFTQWKDIKSYANSKNISIIGDMPIYVAIDSADVWANGDLFQLDEDRVPVRVAGCPPDAFAPKGQLWGNPLYNWEKAAETGFAWWISRIKENGALYDVVRIDHFRGFESYYSIPYGAPDASNGEWMPGPGLAFVNAINGAVINDAAINRASSGAAIIAEDLGYRTPEVSALLAASGYPGMKVLQFAFDSRENSGYMPYTYPRNCVVYTGTHDNTTTLDWFTSARTEDVEIAKDYLGVDNPVDGVWGFIRAALSSVADLAVIPMQDYLCLGAEARMNTPSILGGNWRWRMPPDALYRDGSGDAAALAKKIRRLAEVNGRL